MGRRRTADPHPPTSEPATAPRSIDLPVSATRLDNGLQVLVLPRPRSTIVVCDLYYAVGSADEPAGRSGLAHFVEHMLFKGTARFPKGHIDRLVFASAGEANAETGEDFTHYWFRLPRDHWELALAVEADRMRGALFDPAEVESERLVIMEERARDLDSASGRLEERFLTESFRVHPYRNPILGWPDEFAGLGVSDLRSFYDRHYRPDHAVLVVVGDVDPALVAARARHHFGSIPPSTSARRRAANRREPRQIERREFRIGAPEGVARGLLGWHTVPRPHADSPALDVLSDLLCCGRRSRLWDRLVERDQMAAHVDAENDAGHRAGQFVVSVEAIPGTSPASIESVVVDEIARLALDGPCPSELARSRTRIEAAWRWQQDDLAGLAAGLGAAALRGDWRAWSAEHRAALEVTADDVRRVARHYFRPVGLTSGWSVPRSRRAPATPRVESVPPPPIVPSPPPSTGRPLSIELAEPSFTIPDFHPRHWRLPSGLRVVSEHVPGAGVVSIELHVEAGQRLEAKPGVAHLTGRLREEGTSTRSAEALAEQVEDVGGVLDVYARGASLHLKSEDLALALDVLADLTLRPAFPSRELSRVRRRALAELRADRDDPSYRADALFRREVYGDHPYGRDARGTATDLRHVTIEDVLAHQARFFRPDNAILVVAGDFDPPSLRKAIRDSFGAWRAPSVPLPAPSIIAPPPIHPVLRRVSHEGEQVHLVFGHLGIPRRHPDFDALTVLDHILGSGPGFTDRLSARLRDDLGLAYSVSGGMTDTADLEPGLFRVYVGTGPDQVDLATAAVLEQIDAMHRGDFSDDEVEQARRYLRGAWLFDYQGISQRADRLVDLASLGLPLDEPIRWASRIQRVTPAQVRRAARRHLHPESLVRILHGPLGRGRSRSSARGCA